MTNTSRTAGAGWMDPRQLDGRNRAAPRPRKRLQNSEAFTACQTGRPMVPRCSWKSPEVRSPTTREQRPFNCGCPTAEVPQHHRTVGRATTDSACHPISDSWHLCLVIRPRTSLRSADFGRPACAGVEDRRSLPRWRRDGRELYYRGPDNTLFAVSVDIQREAFGTPQLLFSAPTLTPTATRPPYASVDGSKFLVDHQGRRRALDHVGCDRDRSSRHTLE